MSEMPTYGYREIDSANHGDLQIKKGSIVHYPQKAKCPHCNQPIGTEIIVGEVSKIWIKPNSGFAEMGDMMYLELTNGHKIQGDSENGFSILRVVP